jgi:hypothetical protein
MTAVRGYCALFEDCGRGDSRRAVFPEGQDHHLRHGARQRPPHRFAEPARTIAQLRNLDGASATCPVDDAKRVALLREVRRFFDPLARERRTFYYTWQRTPAHAKGRFGERVPLWRVDRERAVDDCAAVNELR